MTFSGESTFNIVPCNLRAGANIVPIGDALLEKQKIPENQ
jgi:hypothetical protein